MGVFDFANSASFMIDGRSFATFAWQPMQTVVTGNVICAPGLEFVCARELLELGVRAIEPFPGGVSFVGNDRDLARANLQLRSATRILRLIAPPTRITVIAVSA